MKLSVVTINKNNSTGLEKTIQSVTKQKFTDFEYLIIDGGSTDNSVEVIKKYTKDISYWVSEPDEGVYNAMNRGIRKAQGEFCLFLNSGDYLFSDNVLGSVFDLNLDYDIIYGAIMMSDGTIYNYSDNEDITFKYFFNCTLPHPCSFIKTNLFQKVGLYNENLKITSDWAFFLVAICRYNVSIKRIDQVISIFNLEGLSSEPRNKALIEEEKFLIFNDLFPRFIKDYKRLMQIENQLAFIKRNPILRAMVKLQKLAFKNDKYISSNQLL